MSFFSSRRAALLAASFGLVLSAAPFATHAARAQEAPGWFVPGGQQAAAPAAPTRGRARAVPVAPVQAAPVDTAPVAEDPGPSDQPDAVTEAELQQKLANLPQPPIPKLPPIISNFYTATATGDAVTVSVSGPGAALPAPLTGGTSYYLIKGADNVVQLAASAADAAAGTAIAFENVGVGTLKLTAPVAHNGQTNQMVDATVKLPNTVNLLAGGSAPPVGVVGVLGVPDVMKASSAAQAVDKVIGARKEKLQLEAQRAAANWEELKRGLENDIPRLTRDQALARERALQARVRADRRQLQEKQRIIQEAAQVALGQIERTLIQIIRQVAESRGMNLVLHRSQVALNVQEFDITDAVVQQLNKALPTVMIPPDNVDPAALPKDWGSVVAR